MSCGSQHSVFTHSNLSVLRSFHNGLQYVTVVCFDCKLGWFYIQEENSKVYYKLGDRGEFHFVEAMEPEWFITLDKLRQKSLKD